VKNGRLILKFGRRWCHHDVYESNSHGCTKSRSFNFFRLFPTFKFPTNWNLKIKIYTTGLHFFKIL